MILTPKQYLQTGNCHYVHKVVNVFNHSSQYDQTTTDLIKHRKTQIIHVKLQILYLMFEEIGHTFFL